MTRLIYDVLLFLNSLFIISFGNRTNYKCIYICIYTLTFPVFHGVQGRPILAAGPHYFGTATMATKMSLTCKTE